MPPARVALTLASLLGLALLLRSLLLGPVPLWLALAALAAYVAISTLGVFVPQLSMYGDFVSRGDPEDGAVALTFDDGPHPETTRQVLAMLAERGHKATFFVVGYKAERYADVVREIHAAGHGLGVHGFRHDRLFCFKSPRAVVNDIRRSQDVIEAACGVRPRWFRPPIGYTMPRTARGAKRADVVLVAWSARGIDGLPGADPARVARRIERKLAPGAIVLLHDAAEREDFTPASLQALPRILEQIESRRLRTVTLDELLAPELVRPD